MALASVPLSRTTVPQRCFAWAAAGRPAATSIGMPTTRSSMSRRSRLGRIRLDHLSWRSLARWGDAVGDLALLEGTAVVVGAEPRALELLAMADEVADQHASVAT